MKTRSSVRRYCLKNVFRLCLCLVVCGTLALAGATAFLTKPAYACTVVPAAGALPPATECQNYNFGFTAAAPGPLCASMCGIITGLPPGLHAACGPLNANTTWYTITGTPQSGTSLGSPYNVVFTDPDGITYNYQLVVNPCALTITNNYLPQAKEGMAYYVVLGVTGGQPPYTWTATGLPPGLYLSSNGILTGTPLVGSAGNYSFTVTVTDACCATTGHQGFGSLTVAYGTYNISVTIDSSLQAGTTQVSIDNAPVGEISGGDSRQFEGRLGTSHVISVSSPVSSPQNADVRFISDSARQTVSELKPSAYFVFYPEYRITLNSEPAGIISLGDAIWYAKDKTFTASAPAVVDPPNQQGTRYEFNNWLLPSGTTSTNKDLSFVVTGPGKATARYDTLYALTLASTHGSETKWEPAGGDVNWSVTYPKYRMSGIMGFFGGTETAVNASGTAHMTGPQQIQITYESHIFLPVFLMFLLAVVILGGGGWAVYRFAIQPTRAALPPTKVTRRLPEEVIEVEGVVVEEEKRLPARRQVKRLPAPAAKRLPAGRRAAAPKIAKRKPVTRKAAPPSRSRTRQTRRRTTRRR